MEGVKRIFKKSIPLKQWLISKNHNFSQKRRIVLILVPLDSSRRELQSRRQDQRGMFQKSEQNFEKLQRFIFDPPEDWLQTLITFHRKLLQRWFWCRQIGLSANFNLDIKIMGIGLEKRETLSRYTKKCEFLGLPKTQLFGNHAKWPKNMLELQRMVDYPVEMTSVSSKDVITIFYKCLKIGLL